MSGRTPATAITMVSIDVKAPQDRFWNAIQNSSKFFRAAVPDIYLDIQATGQNIRTITYSDVIPNLGSATEQWNADPVTQTFKYSLVAGSLLQNYYYSFQGTIIVMPNKVQWSFALGKKDDAIDPNLLALAVRTITELDAYLLRMG